jgi:hypothetical protein
MSEKPEFVELVTIVETTNATLLTLAKSVLDGPIVGPVQLQVRQDDALEARTLLRDFLES